MTRYILHIGTHKTGSTLIQSFLASNREALRACGVDYPALGGVDGAKSHTHLANQLRRGVEVDVLPGSDADLCVLSSENFCHLHEDGVQRIRDITGPDAAVICYFREPVSHLISMYKQLLKGKRNAQSLYDFIDLAASSLQKDKLSRYHYDDTEAMWRHFQDRSFISYKRMEAKELITSFFLRGGHPLPIDGAFSFPSDRNTSLPDEMSFMLYRLNRMLIDGKLSQEQRDAYAHCIIKGDSLTTESFHDDVNEWSDHDTSDFVAAFSERNPKWAATLNVSAQTIRFPVGNRGGDATLLEHADAMLRASSHIR